MRGRSILLSLHRPVLLENDVRDHFTPVHQSVWMRRNMLTGKKEQENGAYFMDQ
jgi:hypothetical protein